MTGAPVAEEQRLFGGGVVLLVASICYLAGWLKRKNRKPIRGTGWWTISLLGFRNAAHRPSRTVLCVALIASAAFIIGAVDAFRRPAASASDKKSGSGGFPLFAESLLPIVHDINTAQGREALNLSTSNDAATMQEVAELVGVTRPAVNHHFPGKSSLYRAALDRACEVAITA